MPALNLIVAGGPPTSLFNRRAYGSRTRLSQNLRAKRDSKLTYLTAWIASFVRVPWR